MQYLILIAVGGALLLTFVYVAYWQYKKVLREAKNYERGLKMVPLLIHLPPSSDDITVGSRDARDVAEETISQAQILYNVIASTITKGFKSKLYGQRHMSFEVVGVHGLINYYVAVPIVLIEVVKQAVNAAYPSARLEECEEHNIFSKVGRITGTIGGELTLKKEFAYPIATYQEMKRDTMQALLNAMATLDKDDGVAVQILLRPASDSWTKTAVARANKIRKDKGKKGGGSLSMKEITQSLWKPPEAKETKPEDKQLSSLEQATVDAIEDKTRHPGYEVLIRVVASSNTAAGSQAVLKNVVAAFSLFDSPSKNGFKFTPTKDIEYFITSFIFRFFPQEINQNILNSVELATIFHLPDQRSTPTSQLQRQASKQVDGPSHVPEQGLLLGYNVFRGIKKEIRLSDTDRRRHVYIIGQTGTGKSGLLENLALQDMLDGKGFAFLDPHGDSAERLLALVPKERVEDVIYFAPGDMTATPIGLNLFEYETTDQKDFLIQEAIAMLYRLYDPGHTGIIGPRYEHWFRNGALTVMADPNGSSFIDIPQVFNDNDFAKVKIKHLTDQPVLDFWNKEMAQTSDYHKSEVLGWFVSKFGAFLSNEMMRNIIGQTKSGFDLRKIMDNKKILIINIAKMGELNAQLMGMIFVMKFQAAAMSRASIPEEQRVDFTLYADEFQNFATESFEIILSQARKYRLSLVLANQFMTQLTDKIREAIIGNVGTVISGRIGTTDAELMSKKFSPIFDAEDLTKLPNFESITSVMINNIPSSPFSMSLMPPLGHPNPQLADALRKLSSAKYGRPKAEVEKEIFERLRAGDVEREARKKAFAAPPGGGFGAPGALGAGRPPVPAGGGSFLDEWLAKRKQQFGAAPPVGRSPAPNGFPSSNDLLRPPSSQPFIPQSTAQTPQAYPQPPISGGLRSPDLQNKQALNDRRLTDLQKQGLGTNVRFSQPINVAGSTAQLDDDEVASVDNILSSTRKDEIMRQPADTLHVQGASPDDQNALDEIFIDMRGDLHHSANEENPKQTKI